MLTRKHICVICEKEYRLSELEFVKLQAVKKIGRVIVYYIECPRHSEQAHAI